MSRWVVAGLSRWNIHVLCYRMDLRCRVLLFRRSDRRIGWGLLGCWLKVDMARLPNLLGLRLRDEHVAS